MLLFSVGVMVTAAGCYSKVSKTSENMYTVFLEKQSSIKRVRSTTRSTRKATIPQQNERTSTLLCHYGPGILGVQMFAVFFIAGVIFLEDEDHRSARLVPDLQRRPFDQYEPEAGA